MEKRNKIGFQLPNDSRIFLDNEQIPQTSELHPKAKALLMLVAELNELMEKHAKGGLSDEPFSENWSSQLNAKLDKIYI